MSQVKKIQKARKEKSCKVLLKFKNLFVKKLLSVVEYLCIQNQKLIFEQLTLNKFFILEKIKKKEFRAQT